MKFSITTILILGLLAGCVTSKMTSKKILADDTVIKYTVEVNSVGQDFKGSDLSISLDPNGITTANAGAVDNTTSQVTADVAASMVDLVKAMLPYMTPAKP